MIGCICCHGPTDSAGDCPICDAPRTPEDRIVRAIIDKAAEKHWTHKGEALAWMLRLVKAELADAVRVELARLT